MKPKIKMPHSASVEGISGHFFMGQIIDLANGKTLPFDRLIEQLSSKELIFIGEVHDNPEHHLIQVQILQAFMARQDHLTVAMEFFQAPQQNIIDRYLTGIYSESEFLEKVDWQRQWGFEYSFYRPLMLAAKHNMCKILAINAPRHIVRQVAKSGLRSLDSQERAQLARTIDLSDTEHREYLKKVYKYQGHGDLKTFKYFYEAQCVWEDTMAENIADYLKKKEIPVIALTGNGHIVYEYGIPNRTQKRISVDMATIVLSPLDDDNQVIDRDIADYIWLTGKYSRRPGFFLPKNHPKK